mgnify:CR=1 FL=1
MKIGSGFTMTEVLTDIVNFSEKRLRNLLHQRRKMQMLNITFKYKDVMSNWEWRIQSCTVSSVEECKRIYDLDNGDVEYEILEVKEE